MVAVRGHRLAVGRGRRNVSLVNIYWLARAFSVDLPTLMTGVESQRSRWVYMLRHVRHDSAYGGPHGLHGARLPTGATRTEITATAALRWRRAVTKHTTLGSQQR